MPDYSLVVISEDANEPVVEHLIQEITDDYLWDDVPLRTMIYQLSEDGRYVKTPASLKFQELLLNHLKDAVNYDYIHDFYEELREQLVIEGWSVDMVENIHLTAIPNVYVVQI